MDMKMFSAIFCSKKKKNTDLFLRKWPA